MQINRILHSTNGKIIVSIILGLGLATLFRKQCSGKSCYNFVSPDANELTNSTYKFNNKCYNFEPIPKKCNKNVKTVSFA